MMIIIMVIIAIIKIMISIIIKIIMLIIIIIIFIRYQLSNTQIEYRHLEAPFAHYLHLPLSLLLSSLSYLQTLKLDGFGGLFAGKKAMKREGREADGDSEQRSFYMSIFNLCIR